MNAQIRPPRVFISYSHGDEPLMHALELHLEPLRQQGLIGDWSERDISSGQRWTVALNEALGAGDLALLLVTPDFLESAAQWKSELSFILARAEASRGDAIPVILRPVDWADSPLKALKPLPRNGKPVSNWHNQEAAWRDVQVGVRQLLAKRPRKHDSKVQPGTNAGQKTQSLSEVDGQEREYLDMMASLPAHLVKRVEFLIEKRDATGHLSKEEDEELQALAARATELATQHLRKRLSDAGQR